MFPLLLLSIGPFRVLIALSVKRIVKFDGILRHWALFYEFGFSRPSALTLSFKTPMNPASSDGVPRELEAARGQTLGGPAP